MYQIELASKISQFGRTDMEFNLIDSDNIMPTRRFSYSSNDFSENDLENIKNSFITRAQNEYDESQAVPTDYYALMKSVLDENIGQGTYDAIRKALKDLDSEKVILGDLELDVTYPVVTNPENVEEQLKTRVENELGPNKFQNIKYVLKSMGFNEVIVSRKSSIIL